MADPFAKVQPGQPVRISASAWNIVGDMARVFQARKVAVPRGGMLPGGRSFVCRVKNDSLANISRFAVLQITGSLFDPAVTAQLDDFLNLWTFTGETPTATDARLVIALDDIPAGDIGRCIVDGPVPCRVNITNAGHAFATATVSDSTKLTSAASGQVKILSANGSTGEQWCLVCLSGSSTYGTSGEEDTPQYHRIVLDTPGDGTWTVPTGVTTSTKLQMTYIGGGGGGAGSGGGGGGAGIWGYQELTGYSAGNDVPYHIGAGGAGGTPASDGAATTFDEDELGAPVYSTDGGTGASDAGGGASGTPAGDGHNASANGTDITGGNGGASLFGGGGRGGTPTNPGNNGSCYGSGGGGGGSGAAGAAGAGGVIVLEGVW